MLVSLLNFFGCKSIHEHASDGLFSDLNLHQPIPSAQAVIQQSQQISNGYDVKSEATSERVKRQPLEVNGFPLYSNGSNYIHASSTMTLSQKEYLIGLLDDQIDASKVEIAIEFFSASGQIVVHVNLGNDLFSTYRFENTTYNYGPLKEFVQYLIYQNAEIPDHVYLQEAPLKLNQYDRKDDVPAVNGELCARLTHEQKRLLIQTFQPELAKYVDHDDTILSNISITSIECTLPRTVSIRMKQKGKDEELHGKSTESNEIYTVVMQMLKTTKLKKS